MSQEPSSFGYEYDSAITDIADPPRWRWDVPQGFYIVLAVMAMLGTWALLAIVWIYMKWPQLWN